MCFFISCAITDGISVVRVFEDVIFIISKVLLNDEMFNLEINPALRLYNVLRSFYAIILFRGIKISFPFSKSSTVCNSLESTSESDNLQQTLTNQKYNWTQSLRSLTS